MEHTLKNKVVLITGSSIGIGRDTSFKFAKEGAKVVVTYYKDRKEGEEVAKKCTAIGASDILLVYLNIMDNKSIKDCVRKIIEKFDRIDILINNAGVVVWKSLNEQSYDEIENQIRTNLEGLIKMTKECLPFVKEAIVNISSGAGQSGFADLSVYCVTKFGVRGFTQSMIEELPHLKIISINPGETATRMTNFQCIAPERVAEVVLQTVKGNIKPNSEGDVDVWDYVVSDISSRAKYKY